MKKPMACSYFPEDVMIEILKRLPVKYLLQFQCVSKSWFTLIHSPNFVSEHRMFSKGRSSSESIIISDGRHFTHLSGNNLETREQLDYCPLNYRLSLCGCCDGIVCAAVWSAFGPVIYFLCNPATREYKKLPPSCIADFDHVECHVGFGFDRKSNDYKVLRMVSSPENSCRVKRHFTRSNSWRVEVYSMRSNSWREIQPFKAYLSVGDPFDSNRYTNGVLFWDCFRNNRFKMTSILLFDMGAEEFKVIRMPRSVAFGVNSSESSVKFNESSIAVLDAKSAGHIDVWVMDAEFKNMSTSSWVKQFNVFFPSSSFSPLGFTSSGELLCFTERHQLESYHLIDHSVRTLCEGNAPRFPEFVFYRESLAPLGAKMCLG